MTGPKAGDRINNYILEALVGAGSFGQVWRARHHIFPERVAIKVPTDLQYVRNLQREGVAIHGLRHPNIVRALDLDPYGDPPYLIMEFVDGPSVRQVLDRFPTGLPLDNALAIVRGVLKALVTAHAAGVIHRDIKPANILLSWPEGRADLITEDMVRVTDFGLGHVGDLTTSSIMQSGSMTTETGQSISGTLAYMSPEQRSGEHVDARSDLYSCGVVLFELFTGVLPPGADPPSSLREDLPPYLDEVFRRCYTARIRRYGSAEEMLHALSRQRPRSWVPGLSDEAGARCSSCGRSIHADDQFCTGCGIQLVESVPRCPSCQAYVNRADSYCIFCGNDLRVKAR